MAVRKNLRHQDVVRERIRTSQLVRRLTKHVLGKVDMQPTQVTAALGLLKKTLPDLASVEHSGSVDHREVSQYTEAELAAELARVRAAIAGAAEPGSSPQDDAELH